MEVCVVFELSRAQVVLLIRERLEVSPTVFLGCKNGDKDNLMR